MWPVGHLEFLGLSCFRGHFVLLDCGHCYCSGGRSKVYWFKWNMGAYGAETMKPQQGWCNVRKFAMLDTAKMSFTKDSKKDNKTIIPVKKTINKDTGKVGYWGTKDLKATQFLDFIELHEFDYRKFFENALEVIKPCVFIHLSYLSGMEPFLQGKNVYKFLYHVTFPQLVAQGISSRICGQDPKSLSRRACDWWE